MPSYEVQRILDKDPKDWTEEDLRLFDEIKKMKEEMEPSDEELSPKAMKRMMEKLESINESLLEALKESLLAMESIDADSDCGYAVMDEIKKAKWAITKAEGRKP